VLPIDAGSEWESACSCDELIAWLSRAQCSLSHHKTVEPRLRKQTSNPAMSIKNRRLSSDAPGASAGESGIEPINVMPWFINSRLVMKSG